MRSEVTPTSNDPLFETKVRPVLLDIFCKGIRDSSGKDLVLGALLAIAMTPLSWPAAILANIIHLVIWGALVAIFFVPLPATGSLGFLIMVGGLVAIFYSSLYSGTQEFLFNLGIVVTAGALLKWFCESHLNGSFFRSKIFETPAMQTMPAYLIRLTPSKYKHQWDRYFGMYCQATDSDSETELLQAVESYWELTAR